MYLSYNRISWKNSIHVHTRMYTDVQPIGFPMGYTEAAEVDGRRGSNIYAVNQWLWQFGRVKPRLGGLSVEETEEEGSC